MKVFVSGTSADLKSYREAVANRLWQLTGEPPEEQAVFGVDYRTLTEMLRRKIRGCDAVICLIGAVYGAAPAQQSAVPLRSYTQIEYDTARELGKPVFVFFPSADCRLDGAGADSAEEKAWQAAHIGAVRNAGYKWEEFRDRQGLLLLTDEVVFSISPETADAVRGRDVRTHFPTPLALLYEECFRTDRGSSMRRLVHGVLRFASLLALHDSLIHRIFGWKSADTKEHIRLLADCSTPATWQSLLRQSCPADASGSAGRFIAEFEGWERQCGDCVRRLVRDAHDLSEFEPDDEARIVRQCRQTVLDVCADLSFLRNYILFAVTGVDPGTGQCAARILRGCASQSFQFAPHPDSRACLADPRLKLPHGEDLLFLLRVADRSALCLTPAFAYGNADGQGRVHAWRAWGPDPDGGGPRLVFSPFDKQARLELPGWPGIETVLSAWTGQDLCETAFGFREDAGPAARVGPLLDAKAWERLLAIVLPEGEASPVLGGRFRLDAAPLHRGLYADLFGATDIRPARDVAPVPEQPLVHVLRLGDAADAMCRARFRARADRWRRIEHPQVLRLSEASDVSDGAIVPFLLTDRIPDCRSLEQWIQKGDPLPDRVATEAIVLAAEVCRSAHARGTLLCALPTRHFLLGAGGRLFLTGFEAAIDAEWGQEAPSSLQSELRRGSKDFSAMAPELKHGRGVLAPTADVFAMGGLLSQLRSLSPHGAMDALPLRHWGDPWRCMAYHSLARDPNERFQSAEQVLLFINEWLRRGAPPTVEVRETATEPAIHMGTYPVTNREYWQFCRAKGWPLPPHMGAVGRQEGEFEEGPSGRLCGPWMPVTHVSLLDAEAYCRWLTETTNRKWRLPRAGEWRRAAGEGSSERHPWGSADADRHLANFGRYYHGPTVVGAFPKGRSPCGCWDMAGNVWEWCADFVKRGAPRRVVKGGAHDYSADAMQVQGFDARLVTCRSQHVGFRVLCEESRP